MAPLLENRQTTEHDVDESDRVLLDDTLAGVTARGVAAADLPGLEPCGPRRKIFLDPAKTRAAIVTCGGLCPGLNDVIAGPVRNLTYHDKVLRRARPQRRGVVRALRVRPAGRLLEHVSRRVADRGNAVVVVAEGATAVHAGCPGARRWSWGGGGDGSCTCRWRWP
jgi:hypothetical protein